ncbi:MAG: flagellar hook-basal body complex protein [Lactobacillus sp.]|jgi:flagellar hook protein FlgE|nr:flagellar hook-basal body complex protein [Lactobacillus sp.]
MSLFGAMQSGISGLTAQSSSMGAISDNISNVSTVGYKENQVAFQTLVTKQSSRNSYASGGVQPVTKQNVDLQGLLSSSSSSTSLAISGNGYFVVNGAANPGENDLWAYTRAGDFVTDNNGYLQNTAGYYAQGWPLLPWDGNPNATVQNINGIQYMKAYYDEQGNTVYLNDNIIDSTNLKPVNLSNIGGTADPTQNLSFGANLPSSDDIYDASSGSSSGRRSVSALIYDSLGNASNLSLTYTKVTSNSWNMSTSVPSGAASISLSGSYETGGDTSSDVYYAAGQLEFTKIPSNGSVISITDDVSGITYNFEFNDGSTTPAPGNIVVNIATGVVNTADAVEKLNDAIQENMPSAGRFTANVNTLEIVQSIGGNALTIDASRCLACVQSAANPLASTGIPTGIFKIDQIDDDIKNVATINFNDTTPSNYIGKSLVIDGTTYTFTAAPGGPTDIDISSALTTAEVVAALQTTIRANSVEPERFTASGTTLEIEPSYTGPDVVFDTTGMAGSVDGRVRDSSSGWLTVGSGTYTLSNSFTVNNTDVETGAIVPSVRFNADGTPKYFYVDEMTVEWANGAENMNGDYDQGTTIKLGMGEIGTNSGLTNLSGNFTTNYITQDGAKFGSYSGVSVDSNGVVTALFDNGETRPIAILPLATFANPNGMGALTGNVWIETDQSGQALLKQAGTNGAGEISSNALELSTVDLATEFSNMIVTQRAYSAATKIITTSSEMLDELVRMT